MKISICSRLIADKCIHGKGPTINSSIVVPELDYFTKHQVCTIHIHSSTTAAHGCVSAKM
jgi:hypothetical protein